MNIEMAARHQAEIAAEAKVAYLFDHGKKVRRQSLVGRVWQGMQNRRCERDRVERLRSARI